MSKGIRLLFVWLLGVALTLITLTLFHQGRSASVQAAAPLPGAGLRPLANPLNEAPEVGTVNVLYDGSLGGSPDTQGFIYFDGSFGQAVVSVDSVGTTLSTTYSSTIQAGYSGSQTPTLDRNGGYTLRFSLRVISETHNNNDRAGFSVIAISSDKHYAIELDFWTDRVWAQEGGPVGGGLFTHAEEAIFNTTVGLIPYELTILGQEYSLVANNTEILTGSLRDYTAFTGFPDVYETPNFIFMGDNSQSARGAVKLFSVSIITNVTPPDRTVATGTPLVIDNLGVLDIDAAGQDIVAKLAVESGVLTISNGILGGQMSGNGSKTIVITSTLAEINNLLSLTLTYRSNPGFVGKDIATFSLDDQGHTGTGGPLTDTKHFTITVVGPGLHLTKTVSTAHPLPGQRVTYTLRAANSSSLTATQALISDTLPTGLALAGSVSLDPPGAGTTGSPPTLVSGLTLNPGQQITVTFPVTVNAGLSHGSRITNTASITSAEVITPLTDAVALTINRPINLRLFKVADAPDPLRPGDLVTYTLSFSNVGAAVATNVVISDLMPVAFLTGLSYSASGVIITPTAGLTYQWQVADLGSGQGGTITLTGQVSAGLSANATFTNIASIAGSGNEINPANNDDAVSLTVELEGVENSLYLPLILKTKTAN
jgi:uncharacterized repeat protein (TIGR01451 family)